MRPAVTARRTAGSGAALFVLLVGVSLPTTLLAFDHLRCGNRVVSVQATTAEVEARCGAPAYVDRWQLGLANGGQPLEQMEVRYYDFGSSQLLRVLKFRNGRLIDVDTDGYGFAGTDIGDCSMAPGTSKYRLLTSCGEPESRKVLIALRSIQPQGRIYNRYDTPAYSDYVTPVYREEWTYAFDDSDRRRLVTLENGWVIDTTDTHADDRR